MGWAPGAFNALGRYDPANGAVVIHDFGAGREVDEPVFVPRSGRHEEGDGWIMAYVYDVAGDSLSFVILNAIELDMPPIAEIALPRRVPHGFHGNWIPTA
jgi:carotenoid cleavage dioxygenase-like enzyme